MITDCDYSLRIYVDWRSHHKTNYAYLCRYLPFVYPASHWSGAPLTWLTKDWQLRNSFFVSYFFLYLAWPNRSGHDYADCEHDDDDYEKQRHNQKKKETRMWVCAHDDGHHDGQQQMHTKKDTDFFKELLPAFANCVLRNKMVISPTKK